jgi:hypothetical protein
MRNFFVLAVVGTCAASPIPLSHRVRVMPIKCPTPQALLTAKLEVLADLEPVVAEFIASHETKRDD